MKECLKTLFHILHSTINVSILHSDYILLQMSALYADMMMNQLLEAAINWQFINFYFNPLDQSYPNLFLKAQLYYFYHIYILVNSRGFIDQNPLYYV